MANDLQLPLPMREVPDRSLCRWLLMAAAIVGGCAGSGSVDGPSGESEADASDQGDGPDAGEQAPAPDAGGDVDPPDSGAPDPGCSVGSETACDGPGGCAAAQLCAADGSWGPCTCQPGGALDLGQAMIFDNPTDLAQWPETTAITRVEFQPGGQDGVRVEFSRRDGEGRWPDVTPPGWKGPIYYTLGMALLIDGQWYASAAIQFWYGLEQSGGNVALDDQIALNWFYEPGRWGPMAGYQPATGETIGIFVVAGNVRAVYDDSQSIRERSNVVLVSMPDVSGATYDF